MMLIAAIFMVSGALLLVLAAWGVIVLPDTVSRQHAATKAGTLSLAMILIGVMFLEPELDWIVRLGFIVLFLLTTLPLASHMLARAAIQEQELRSVTDNAKVIE
jgi:multicomponent Na+:H+ antiporter subunit G